MFSMKDSVQQQMQGILQPIVDRVRKLEAGLAHADKSQAAADESLVKHSEGLGQLNAGLLALNKDLKSTNSNIKTLHEALDRTTRQKDQLGQSVEATQAHLGRVEASLVDTIASLQEIQRHAVDGDQEITALKAGLEAANAALGGSVANNLKAMRQGIDELNRRQERTNQTAAELKGQVDRSSAKLHTTTGHAERNETRIKELEKDLQVTCERLAAECKSMENLSHKAAQQSQSMKSMDADLRLIRRSLDKMDETQGSMGEALGNAASSLNELGVRITRDENRMSQSDSKIAKLERMLSANTNTDEESSSLLTQVHSESRRLSAQLSKTEHQVADLEMKHGLMAESMDKQGETVNDLVKGHRRVVGTTQTLTADLDSTNQAMVGVRQGLETTKTAVTNLKMELSSNSDGVAALAKSMAQCEANFTGMHHGFQSANTSVRASLSGGAPGLHEAIKASAQVPLPGLVEGVDLDK